MVLTMTEREKRLRHLKAVAKYDSENTVQIKLKLNKKSDADLIKLLESVPNKQGFIKHLLRKELET